MVKRKALVTAEIIRETLEEALGDKIDFTYDGYGVDHQVMPRKELLRKVRDVEILICEYDTIDEEVFRHAEKLELIVCCRGGVNSVISLESARKRGVIVCNNAGRNAEAVTDMAMGFILNLTRNITKTNDLIHSRLLTAEASTKPKEYVDTIWGLDDASPFIQYRGCSVNHMVLGIVGYGHAGRVLAKKANAFGMKILAYSPPDSFQGKPAYVQIAEWQELLEQSDVISLHCTLNEQTRNMFTLKEFQQMKTGAYFINTARGELVVEEDLVAALKTGKLSGAALDVTRKEPISATSILLEAPNLLLTPHIAGSSYDVQFCGTNMVIKCLAAFLEGRTPDNCVMGSGG